LSSAVTFINCQSRRPSKAVELTERLRLRKQSGIHAHESLFGEAHIREGMCSAPFTRQSEAIKELRV
jgi:hypothetical protein